ncbi:MAG: CpsB/CapC family capsule biosynthesis tyrosine phosphatase [Coriobacteriales bacterium]|jgi:protein-tyrosine phosphatase
MRDMHSHILPEVDDGASSIDESLAMVEAARKAGVTQIVCTPHCREPYFDFEAMWDAFRLLKQTTAGEIELSMGFEVNIQNLWGLGNDWIDRLAFEDTGEFLLELEPGASPAAFDQYERAVFDIQGHGHEVIIAHPERYIAIQNDINLANRLIEWGCKLQASADFIAGGRFGREKKPAKRMLKKGMYSYIGSDAHNVHHYELFAKAMEKFGDMLR